MPVWLELLGESSAEEEMGILVVAAFTLRCVSICSEEDTKCYIGCSADFLNPFFFLLLNSSGAVSVFECV